MKHRIGDHPGMSDTRQYATHVVGADSNLSHRADRNLSQGWKPALSSLASHPSLLALLIAEGTGSYIAISGSRRVAGRIQ